MAPIFERNATNTMGNGENGERDLNFQQCIVAQHIKRQPDGPRMTMESHKTGNHFSLCMYNFSIPCTMVEIAVRLHAEQQS